VEFSRLRHKSLVDVLATGIDGDDRLVGAIYLRTLQSWIHRGCGGVACGEVPSRQWGDARRLAGNCLGPGRLSVWPTARRRPTRCSRLSARPTSSHWVHGAAAGGGDGEDVW